MHAPYASIGRMVLIGFIVAVATLVGCATTTGDRARRAPFEPSCCKSVEATPRRAAVVRTAAKLVGATTIQANGKRIAYDCAGVTRAIEIVERALAIHGAPVYVLHEIVHNPHVVEDLRSKGAIFVENLEGVPERAVTIFSAHGVAKEVCATASSRR